MKQKLALTIILFWGFIQGATAQPSGTLTAGANDVSFGSNSVVKVVPSEISVLMELSTSTEVEEQMVSEHTAAQALIFETLNSIGATYEGQAETDFDIRKNTSFVRRKVVFTVVSNISATAITDKQLADIAALLDESDDLSLDSFSVNYSAEDSVDEIQKKVVDGLLGQAQDYQTKNKTKLNPKGISKMDITSEPFGEDVISELLEDNDLPGDAEVSAEAFSLTGVNHTISAEIIFQ